jgi:subtilisin family serine protease
MNNNCGVNIISEDYADFIADYELDPIEELAKSEICYIRIDPTFASVYVPQELVPERPLDAYGYKVFARLLGLLDVSSIEDSGVIRLNNVSDMDLRGQGTLIGIVDTGIDYTHKAFLNEDGTTRIVSIWDQSVQSDTPPEGLLFGTEYTSEQIYLALQNSDPKSIVPSTDEIGHGTFLAGVAAGKEDRENEFSGVVPDAELIVVKLKPAKNRHREFYMVSQDTICYQENDVMLGVKYLVDVAEKLDRPLSICIGLGTSQGAHDEVGALSRYLTSIVQKEGISVSIAAGNEGISRHHYEGILGPGIDNETVELNVGPNEPGLYLELWGDNPNTFSIEMMSPGGEVIPAVVPRLNERRETGFIFEKTVVSIYFQLVGSRSGAQLVIVKLKQPTEGIWQIKIHKINKTLDLRYNIWLPINGFVGKETYFIQSSPNMTLTSPGNVAIPIVVTAYDNSNDSLYLNCSRGYTRLGSIAPDIAAPGVNLVGPAPGNSYVTMSGTSVSAAHTAGIAAMLLEWGKIRGNVSHMDGTDVKNLLIRGARRDTGKTYPSREWGYGILDIYGVYESLRGNP